MAFIFPLIGPLSLLLAVWYSNIQKSRTKQYLLGMHEAGLQEFIFLQNALKKVRKVSKKMAVET